MRDRLAIRPDYIYFEPLKLDHVLKMMNWGRHQSQLFQDYNFNFSNQSQCSLFYLEKTLPPLNSYFAIIYAEEVIGFLGNKNINWLTRSSTLGLVLNPSLVGLGFGSVVLPKFLDYYFNEKSMKKMKLLVAAYNDRALKLYKKVGFKKVSQHLEPYPNLTIDPDSQEYLDHQDAFVKKGSVLYNYVYKMELRKEDFNFEIYS
ncbi:MAG: GNAT family protein [Bacillota bacterium]|nr:GNAT family protein [Bacillota bacterium]